MSAHNDRLQWVDAAKGISIILVVMMYSVFNVGQNANGVGVLHYVIGFATPFRMPEFFLISGLFLSQVIGRTWRAYADRRVLHYFYFYVLWMVIHLVVKVGIASADPVGALQQIAFGFIEPYGVLWFIYLLAVFGFVTKLTHELKVPRWAVWGAGALLQMSNLSSPSYLVEQFAHYFVYFYSGYLLAPTIFRIVDWTNRHTALAIVGLIGYALVNIALVFSPGYAVLPGEIELGYAGLPGVRLTLAIVGSIALCITAGQLVKLSAMDWLRWLGEHSIVVYLVFVLPMSFSRVVFDKIGLSQNVSLTSLLVIFIAIGVSVGLYGLVQWSGRARFLFERPAWAHIPGTKGSRRPEQQPVAVPAE